jgi:hypothetical protein
MLKEKDFSSIPLLSDRWRGDTTILSGSYRELGVITHDDYLPFHLKSPGLVKTYYKQFIETLKYMHPIDHIAEPEEIANGVVWLLAGRASFVPGHTFIS